MKQSVLVLGGSYFIGKKIVEVLAYQEYEVTVLNRGTRPLLDDRIKQIVCDRNDQHAMQDALKGKRFDKVVDVSALNSQWVETTCDALDLKNLSSYVFISSSAVYDIDNCTIPINETDPIGENKYWTTYGTRKYDAERFLRERLQGIAPLVILRPTYVYGEGNCVHRESFIFDHVLADKPIIVPGDGKTLIQFIEVGDLAKIVSTILDSNINGCNIFNVGNKKAVSLDEWVQVCAEAAGKKASIVHFDYKKHGIADRSFFPFYDYDNVLDVDKIQGVYSKEIDFLEGLTLSFNWYLENTNAIRRKDVMAEAEENVIKLLGMK